MNDMFRTPIDFPKATFNIGHPQSILALGSCFSQNIGERMAAAKFPVSINPFGTLFDPISIHAIFDAANLESKEEELIFYQGYWHAVKYHGSFKHKDKSLLLEKIRQSKQQLINYLKTSGILMLTYGTAHVWKTREKNEIVGNCHKLPGHFFYRHLLSSEEIIKTLQESLFTLKRLYPHLQVIVSISPVRHLKLGMIDNQLSKSVLKVAVSEVVNKMPEIYYFPAYEIMMDDLRDYRFYAQDMIHPSDLAIEYIFDGFKSVFFSEKTKERVKIWEKFGKSLNHRPFDGDNELWINYKQKYKGQLKQYKDEFPMLDWSKEEQFCELS
jgi:hypothetical protein